MWKRSNLHATSRSRPWRHERMGPCRCQMSTRSLSTMATTRRTLKTMSRKILNLYLLRSSLTKGLILLRLHSMRYTLLTLMNCGEGNVVVGCVYRVNLHGVSFRGSFAIILHDTNAWPLLDGLAVTEMSSMADVLVR